MLYCVGRYHPPPGENGDLPPGYDLTPAELDEIGALEGVPITLEHTGVAAAVSLLMQSDKHVEGYSVGVVLDSLCKDDISRVPVGVCLDVSECDSGYYVLYGIDVKEWPVLKTLLPHMTGISLSHMSYGGKLVALELSLCVKPARPGCYQLYTSADYVDALQYMRSKYSRVKASMAAEPSEIEQILSRLPDAEQKIISARFETMVKEIQRQRQEAKTAMDEAQELRKSASAGNTELLKWGIKNIEQQLPDEVKSTFNCNSDQLMPELTSSDAEAVRRAVDRLICACSHQMMQMSSRQQAQRAAPEETSTRKRVRSVTPEPVAQAPATASAVPVEERSSQDLLRDAMANTFGPFSV